MEDNFRRPLVLEAKGLSIALRQRRWFGYRDERPIVHRLDLSVNRGETLAIVGESGCGKTMTALALSGLLPPGVEIVSGSIELMGERISGLSEAKMRGVRGSRIGVVFQDPMTALNPVITIGEQIEEAILAHQPIGGTAARARSVELLNQVRLPQPHQRLKDYPHQLSGGMRQRVMIAMAICNEPDVLIADEPTTALDATVQVEVMSLLREIQKKSGMALILITHDLGVVSRWAERVVVMYAGKKVEERATTALLETPLHPYSRALIRARPRRRPAQGRRHRLVEIPGSISVSDIGRFGCAFCTRCEVATEFCRTAPPILRTLEMQTGWVACHHAGVDLGVREIAT